MGLITYLVCVKRPERVVASVKGTREELPAYFIKELDSDKLVIDFINKLNDDLKTLWVRGIDLDGSTQEYTVGIKDGRIGLIKWGGNN